MSENAFNPADAEVVTDFPAPPAIPKRPWYWWIVDYNPFYLLSAVFMLLGMLALSNTTTWNPVPLSRLVTLLVTLQVYELVALGIGVFLYRKLGPRRDAVQLLVLVLLFAVDVSFLMSEIATDRLLVGSLVSGGLLALALVKGYIVVRIIGLRVGTQYLLTGAAGLAMLYLAPVLLTAIDDGRGGVEVLHFYALWWLIGLSPIVFDLAKGMAGDREAPIGGSAAKWLTLLVVLPWASLAVHTGVLHYVYDRPFMAPLSAPILIGIALLLRAPAAGEAGRQMLVARTVLIGVAALVSLPDPGRLSMMLPDLGVSLGSKEVGLGAAWLAIAWCNAPRLLPHFLTIGILGLAARWFGPSLEQMGAFVGEFMGLIHRGTQSLIPRTRFAWGCVAIAGAFASMVVGLVLSLWGDKERVPKGARE